MHIEEEYVSPFEARDPRAGRCTICLVPTANWKTFCSDCLRLYDAKNPGPDWMKRARKKRKVERAVNLLEYGPVDD